MKARRGNQLCGRTPIPERAPVEWSWWQVLIILVWLRPPISRAPEPAILRTLLVIVGMVLITGALTSVGAPQVVSAVLSHWPALP